MSLIATKMEQMITKKLSQHQIRKLMLIPAKVINQSKLPLVIRQRKINRQLTRMMIPLKNLQVDLSSRQLQIQRQSLASILARRMTTMLMTSTQLKKRAKTCLRSTKLRPRSRLRILNRLPLTKLR